MKSMTAEVRQYNLTMLWCITDVLAVLVEIYKTLSETISGPNRHNQRELLQHKACEPMLLFL